MKKTQKIHVTIEISIEYDDDKISKEDAFDEFVYNIERYMLEEKEKTNSVISVTKTEIVNTNQAD